MPPNIYDPARPPQENEDLAPKPSSLEEAGTRNNAAPGAASLSEHPRSNNNVYAIKTILYTMNLVAHILIGSVVGIALIFAFRSGLPLSATPLHIVLCVMGYHLLMAEAIMSLSSSNGWSSHLRLVDKRRAHMVLQLMGSTLAISGTFVRILDKEEHFTTLHGKFGLTALVFTSVSLVNGLASLWAYELRRFLPGNLTKLTHICFGTVGFSAACICLCFGFDKELFRTWISDSIATTAISFTASLLILVIITPLTSFYLKFRALINR